MGCGGVIGKGDGEGWDAGRERWNLWGERWVQGERMLELDEIERDVWAEKALENDW